MSALSSGDRKVQFSGKGGTTGQHAMLTKIVTQPCTDEGDKSVNMFYVTCTVATYFDDEDPSPSSVPSCSIHFRNER